MSILGAFSRIGATLTDMMRAGQTGRRTFSNAWVDGSEVQLTAFGSSTPIDNYSIEWLWKTQPHLRTVIGFLARSVSHVGLHAFAMDEDGERDRDRSSDLAALLRKPNPIQTGSEMIFALVGYLALYDQAYLHVLDGEVRVLPTGWVEPVEPAAFDAVKDYLIAAPDTTDTYRAAGTEIIEFRGWTPGDPTSGTSPVESLRLILEEQHHSRVHRKQLWKRNGRIGSYVARPAADGVQVPRWSDADRKRFMDMLDAFMGDKGARAGGMPLIEDGMKIETNSFKSADEQWAESIKLSLSTCAQVYFVNPTMVGLLDNANYSNVREFRKMLYGDTLGPLFTMIEDRFNAFLLPMLGYDTDGRFVEFNVEAKLRGSFEEQASVMSAAIGGPWMTRNEGRRMRNLPPVDGGDALIVPLNLGTPETQPAQPSEATSAGKPMVKAREMITATQVKTRLPESHEDEYRETLRKFFERQARVVSDKYGAKADGDWWDADRWNRELTEDLLAMNDRAAVAAAKMILADLGVDATFDRDRIKAWLAEYSRVAAESINEQTLALLEEAIAAERAIPEVYEATSEKRSTDLAVSAITAMSAFGQIEAMRQAPGESSKTWITGPNPRPAHAAMDGQTVALDENFSNGMSWPGDPAGDVDDLAGCNCSLLINYQEDTP